MFLCFPYVLFLFVTYLFTLGGGGDSVLCNACGGQDNMGELVFFFHHMDPEIKLMLPSVVIWIDLAPKTHVFKCLAIGSGTVTRCGLVGVHLCVGGL